MSKTKLEFEKYYVLDTNIMLDDATSIVKFSESSKNLIILPETVLDEIDSKKSGFEEINFQAREFARILSDSKIVDKKHTNENTIISILVNGGLNIRIDIVSKKTYRSDFNNCALNIINDRKILEIAKDCELLYNQKIEFISSDIMARTRAISIDIESSDILGDKSTSLDFEFHKEIFITEELNIKNLDGKKIIDLDPEYKKNYYAYTINFKSGHTCYGYVVNNQFNLIDTEQDFKSLQVKPLSVEQKFFCSGLLEDNIDVVLVDAKAGSGKTLLALAAGLRLVDLKKYSKIIYIRNSIESTDKGEDVGYLPGLEEKFKIYNHPLYDSLDFIVRQSFKSKKHAPSEQAVIEAVDEMKKNYNINTMWVGEMRGRTISNAFVIIDECLAKDQILYTKDGIKTIEEIEQLFIDGNKIEVLSKNLNNEIVEFKEMLSLKVEDIEQTNEEMYELELEDGTFIKVTGNHKLFINGKYQTILDVLESKEDLILEKYVF